MLAKIALTLCLVAAVSARPDRPSSGFGYQAPQVQQSYSQPQPSYSQSQPSYSQSQPSYSQSQPSYQQREEGMPFNFAYEVKDDYSGNDYSHSSNSDGRITEGEYRVLLPDGRTQIVRYHADADSGYNAEVSYEGEARYEAPQQRSYSQQQPSYEQPRNTYEQPRNTYEQPRNTYQQPQRNSY